MSSEDIEKTDKYITKVGSLEEALALAEEWKLEGRFDLFRGQAQNWPVVSTRFRIDEKDFNEHKEMLTFFFEFISSNKQLKSHIKSVDEMYAIAQHYGLVTNYIDFTKEPEIAGYFATNSKSNKIGEYACIICLNSSRFAEIIEFVEPLMCKILDRKDARSQIVDIHVKNLWRLQAQEGVFLYSPFPTICH